MTSQSLQYGGIHDSHFKYIHIQTTITSLFLGWFWIVLHQNKWFVKHFTPRYTYNILCSPLINIQLTLTTLREFRKWQIGDIFLLFPRKQVFTFEMSIIGFWEKEMYFNIIVCWKFYPDCQTLTLVLLNLDTSCFCKQCRSRSEANWSGSALFAIKHVNLKQQSGSSRLFGWKLEVGVTS